MVVEPDAFAVRGSKRRGGHAEVKAATTVATLQSSGWMTTIVDARTAPPAAWSAVVGAQVVGAR
jgi:hypothetical protein